jgi:hypothetical protein
MALDNALWISISLREEMEGALPGY